MKNPLLTKKNIRRITEFLNSPRGLKYIPYGLANLYISWFCKTSFAQKRFFRKKLPIVEEFLEQFPGRWDRQEVIAGFFALNYLHGWRASAVSHFRKCSFRRRVKINGLKEFRKSYEEGRGVIVLGSHFGLPAVSFSTFPRLGFTNFYTILGEKGSDSVKFRGMREKNKPGTLIFKRGGESGAFGLLFEAKKLLEEGSILHLLGDGAHGRASHNLAFLGKMRGFRATFAELSVLTGAAIFPVFITPRKGKIIITIENPLNTGSEDMEREERVNMTVREYAALLEKKWMESPQYINGGFMEMYNHSIPITDDEQADS